MKIIGDTTCPNCKKDHEAQLDVDSLDIKQVEIPEVKNARVQQPQQTVQIEKPVEKIKEVLKVPSYIPKYKCKNCKENHKNKEYKQAPRFKCSNCGQFSPNDDSCVWCDGKDFDEIDEEELRDLGIDSPEESEHEHEHE